MTLSQLQHVPLKHLVRVLAVSSLTGPSQILFGECGIFQAMDCTAECMSIHYRKHATHLVALYAAAMDFLLSLVVYGDQRETKWAYACL
jgi:hypothetical protein